MSSNYHSLPLIDILYSFSLDERGVNAEVLDEFIQLYPQHATALTEFAIELVVDSLLVEPVREGSTAASSDTGKRSPSVARAMSHFQSLMYSLDRTDAVERKLGSNSVNVPNPFASLEQREFRDFARELQASTVLVNKLRDRQIEPGTLTKGFMQRVSDLLRTKFEVIAAHFAAPASPRLSGEFYKADDKPVIGLRQTFEEAVRSSNLTEEQQRHLLSL